MRLGSPFHRTGIHPNVFDPIQVEGYAAIREQRRSPEGRDDAFGGCAQLRACDIPALVLAQRHSSALYGRRPGTERWGCQFSLDTFSGAGLAYGPTHPEFIKLKPCGRTRYRFSLLLSLALSLSQLSSATAKKIIFDTDPGSDDAMALMLALNSPELDVRAITVVPGNVTASQGLGNAMRLVSLANRCDIPVAAGAQHPLFQKLITAEFWHGKNGLANVELPASKCKVDLRFGPDLIIQMVHAAPHEITLVPVGPLTNIALAVLKDPSIVPLVREVILMGGSISGGNVNAAAEANIYNDPEAAQIVFQAGWPVTMVGLDVGDKTLFTRPYLDELARTHGPVNDFIAAVARYLIDLSARFDSPGAPMYDPLAVGVAIDATFVKAPEMHVDVETRGDFTRGETVANRHGYIERNALIGERYVIEGVDKVSPNARVCTEVDAERFLKLFVSRIQNK
jgi:purine nucleosidase